jgi:hypothetical protein
VSDVRWAETKITACTSWGLGEKKLFSHLENSPRSLRSFAKRNIQPITMEVIYYGFLLAHFLRTCNGQQKVIVNSALLRESKHHDVKARCC